MRKVSKKLINLILLSSVVAIVGGEFSIPLTVYADKTTSEAIEDAKDKIEEDKNKLNALNNQILDLEGEQDILQEEIDDVNAEIVNTMTSISLKEDEITAKEAEIAQKKIQIQETQAEYEAAKNREEEQREGMAISTRLMYENGTSSFLGALLLGSGFSDILNKLDFVERIYAYERDRLLAYIETKNQVHDLWDKLEREKTELEADRLQLEADKLDLQGQKDALDIMLADKQAQSEDFAAEIAKAREQAQKAKEALKKDEEELKKLEAKKAAEDAANRDYADSDYSDVIDNAAGSELGKQVARFACQYIGNKYVYGGTSLTDGTDCSGFTYRVYANFGFKLPRTSLQQRSAGKAVDYEDAQPGDLICYDGHVGLYIGGGLIVHASNSQPYPKGGIKVSKANYRKILAVRRIIK